MVTRNDYLMHYGMKRRSGRYPWGSGENPYQHSGDFYSRYLELHKQGLSNADIANTISDEIGLKGDDRLNSSTIVDFASIAKNDRKINLYKQIDSMTEDGHGDSEIGRRLGLAPNTVKSMREEKARQNVMEVSNIADKVRNEIETRGMIDIGKGAANSINVSEGKLRKAAIMLENEDYPIYTIKQKYATNNNGEVTITAICPKGTTFREAYLNRGEIQTLDDFWSPDGGKTIGRKAEYIHYPESLSSKRLQVFYDEDGGTKKDGVIELRRGPDDISLGSSNYAQVRILVDGTHYLKGMAMYSDDLPPGIDVRFNSNKKRGTPIFGETSESSVLKPIKHDDPNNPFGTYIKPNGQHGVINKVYEEGDWDTWSRTLPAQFLSKQGKDLIQRQLNYTYDDKVSEFTEIKSIPNKTVRRKLLDEFANDCDAASIHLKAAGLPGQSAKVILPVTTLSDKEIYCPTLDNGTRVALIRYPHQGTFEIPELVVNNNHPDAKKIIGPNTQDAVGISLQTAEILSGADFDGDSVTVIPLNNKIKIKTRNQTDDIQIYKRELEGFNARSEYPKREGMKVMTDTGKKMGEITNLLTDAGLKGAPAEDICKLTKHAYVVIDAEKHELDYQRSYIENDIARLKEKYQGRYNEETGRMNYGASTLITKSKSKVHLEEHRRGNPNINPLTGEKTWDEVRYIDPATGNEKILKSKIDPPKSYYDKNGNLKIVTEAHPKMELTKDAFTLSSGHPTETFYAEYANRMKALANEARKESIATGRLEKNKEATQKYAAEVASLDAKFNAFMKNKPRERRAQVLANSKIDSIVKDNPTLKNKDNKDKFGKLKNQILNNTRIEVGSDSKSVKIIPTEKEWEAIEAGAISDHHLKEILDGCDMTEIRKLATPRTQSTMTPAKLARLNAMKSSGMYTIAQMAQMLNVSTSTVSKYLKES